MLALEEMCAQDMICEYDQSVLKLDDKVDEMLDILEGDDNSVLSNIDFEDDEQEDY